MKKVKFIIAIAGFSLIAGITHADVFPKDAQNVRNDLTGDATWTAFTPASGSVYTVLYESFNSSANNNGGTLTLQCGDVKTLQVNDFGQVHELERFKEAKCSNSLIATTAGLTGGKVTTVSVVFVPYNTASKSSDMPDRLGVGLASASFTAYASVTAGDVLIILLLCALVMLQLFNIFRRHV